MITETFHVYSTLILSNGVPQWSPVDVGRCYAASDHPLVGPATSSARSIAHTRALRTPPQDCMRRPWRNWRRYLKRAAPSTLFHLLDCIWYLQICYRWDTVVCISVRSRCRWGWTSAWCLAPRYERRHHCAWKSRTDRRRSDRPWRTSTSPADPLSLSLFANRSLCVARNDVCHGCETAARSNSYHPCTSGSVVQRLSTSYEHRSLQIGYSGCLVQPRRLSESSRWLSVSLTAPSAWSL